jgi:hypothetical protein
MSRQERLRFLNQFLKSMDFGSRCLLVAVVFFCFAPVGLLSDLTSLGRSPWYRVGFMALWSGAMAVAYGAAVTSSRYWTLLVLITLTIAGAFAMRRWLPEARPPSTLGAADVIDLRAHIATVVGMTVATVALVYTSIVFLLQREGQRFVRAYTEIRLAQEIHQSLVPRLEGSSETLEWRGVSRPSGEVGGDLVDVLQQDGHWLGCVADVSGHGVAAGVLMGMFKTALHAAASESSDVGDLLTSTNRVLHPLKQSNTFVTAACLRMVGPSRCEYALAGHPPLLHVRCETSRAVWVGESQVAIGITADARYHTSVLDVSPGDLLLVVTDGLLEVVDRQDRELGQDGLVGAVQDLTPDAPLAAIEERMFAVCRAHGVQVDDQTLLIVRIRRASS